MGSGASTASGGAAELLRPLQRLAEAMEEVVYIQERWPCIIDERGHASSFLKYQSGGFTLASDPVATLPNNLRRSLVGGLQHGHTFAVCFDSFKGEDFERFFQPAFFPREVLNKNAIFNEQVWAPLLRAEEGDPPPINFNPRAEFVFVVIVRGEVPPAIRNVMGVIRLSEGSQVKSTNEGCDNDADAVAQAYGALEVKRNSTQLVEAAFDGDLDTMKSWIDKGYHVESCDGHKQTALSEAACKGHTNIVQFLLAQGADPNAVSDTGRSPVYRAAFNGHVETCRVLLEAGADLTLRDKISMDSPFDVARTPEMRQLIEDWDQKETVRLIEQRKAEIARKREERIKSAVEMEEFARQRLREDLIDKAERGDVSGIVEQLQMLAREAENSNQRSRATAEVRTESGMSLLHIAAKTNNVELAQMLLTHWHTCDEHTLLAEGELSAEAKVFRTNVNGRDLKGWNPAAIAVFHESKDVLRLLLEHGCNPDMLSHYNKSARDLAQDELDAAGRVVKSKAEIRSVIDEWDRRPGIFHTPADTCHGGTLPEERLPRDGSPIAMQLEMAEERGAKNCAAKKGAKKASSPSHRIAKRSPSLKKDMAKNKR